MATDTFKRLTEEKILELARRTHLFDEKWYLSKNQELILSKEQALSHYCFEGWKENRDPSPQFSTEAYVSSLKEIKLTINPLSHYEITREAFKKGKVTDIFDNFEVLQEDTKGLINLQKGGIDPNWYWRKYNLDVLKHVYQEKLDSIDLTTFYISHGNKMGHLPNKNYLNFEQKDEIFRGRRKPFGMMKDKFELDEEKEVIKRSIIYTCISNDYDELLQHPYIMNGWEYICFTDNKELLVEGNVGHWKIEKFQKKFDNPTFVNRWHKLMPHRFLEDFNRSIYIDANVTIDSKYIFDCIEDERENLLVPHHFTRFCVFQEIAALLNSSRYSSEVKEKVIKYKKFLQMTFFPEHVGLSENNIIFRYHNKSVITELMEMTWFIFLNYAPRDQLALPYAIWKKQYPNKNMYLPNTRMAKEDFSIYDHKAELITLQRHKIKKIHPVFKTEAIPIIFSANSNFKQFLGVVLESLISNRRKKRKLDIIILQTDFNDEEKAEFYKFFKSNSISIRFFDMGPIHSKFQTIITQQDRVPVDTYNKCFLAEILEDYKKIIYLDTDILFKADINELYETDLEGKSLAATLNVANIVAAKQNKIIKNKNFGIYIKKILGFETPDKYFQAGVLVIDFQRIKIKNLLTLALKEIQKIKTPIFNDQCIFNSIFKDDYTELPLAWNVVWYIRHFDDFLKYLSPGVINDIINAQNNPKIIHYAGPDKPTNTIDWRYADDFWNNAIKGVYSEYFWQEAKNKKFHELLKIPDKNVSSKKILVIFHVYNSDQIEYFIKKLNSIKSALEIIITTSLNVYDLRELLLKYKPSALHKYSINRFTNVGSDVLPFLKTITKLKITEYDYLLKIHTKSPRPDDSKVYGLPVAKFRWRDDMVEALIGSESIFSNRLKLLKENPNVGIVGCKRYLFSTRNNNEFKNYKLDEYSLWFDMINCENYFGGTIFLVKANLFLKLKNHLLENKWLLDEKDPEYHGKHSHTRAHIFERIFGLIVESQGYEVRGV